MSYELIGHCAVWILGSTSIILLLLLLFFLCVYLYGTIENYQYQKKWWNKGISLNTNTPWTFVRRYDKRCTYKDEKGYEIIIGFRSIDKYKVKDEK